MNDAEVKVQQIIADEDFQEEDTQKDKYLIFTIGEEDYGLDIKYIVEIIGIQPITPIPEMPEYIRGIINLRGRIIPVMDVRLRFRKAERSYDDRTCIIVTDIGELVVGLIIDRVVEVVDISQENISLPPQIGAGFHNKYVKAIGKLGSSVKLILDSRRLLNEDDVDELKAINN
ncbi:MAG: chemotaxis protein CheW [Bacillota bacterium]